MNKIIAKYKSLFYPETLSIICIYAEYASSELSATSQSFYRIRVPGQRKKNSKKKGTIEKPFLVIGPKNVAVTFLTGTNFAT